MFIDNYTDTLIAEALRKGNWFFLFNAEDSDFLEIETKEAYLKLKS